MYRFSIFVIELKFTPAIQLVILLERHLIDKLRIDSLLVNTIWDSFETLIK